MFGTRPEVIKLAPVVLALSAASNIERVLDVTGQQCQMRRRENFDGGLESVCGLARQADRGDVQIVDLVHLDPEVGTAQAALGARDAVHLISPPDDLPFAHSMREADLIVTDPDGVQEQAPGGGQARHDRAAQVESPPSTTRLIGTDGRTLVDTARQLLHHATAYEAMARAANPNGDRCARGGSSLG
jgi:UDP-N-acetylglucosamine 2-epimerase (non-hydrolysing)